jgi:hypothetical protein
LTDPLSIGILLLLDPREGSGYVLNALPAPIFAVWAKMVPAVVLGIEVAAATVELYHDTIEYDPDHADELVLLKLEVPTSGTTRSTVIERFEAIDEGSNEAAVLLTVDPRRLTKPGRKSSVGRKSGIDGRVEQ